MRCKQSFPSAPAAAADGGIGKAGGAAFVRCFESRALLGEPGLAELKALRQPGLREG